MSRRFAENTVEDITALSQGEREALQTLSERLKSAPPLSPELAYLRARDLIGGEAFVRAREELSKLDRLDRASSRNLADFEDQVDRAARLGRIVPRNAIKHRELYTAHRQARDAYNAAARRFEAKLQALQTPEARREIQSLTQSLLASDLEQRAQLAQAKRPIEELLARREKAQRQSVSEAPLTQKVKSPKFGF